MQTPSLAISWWRQLAPQWKQAFAEVIFKHTNEPTPGELAQLYAAPALRFTGPTAPFPSMSFELSDLSGLTGLNQLETVVVTHHFIESIKDLASLKQIKHLFLFNNRIKSLDGIETLAGLEQLYVQCNQIESLEPLKNLFNLRELYVNDNKISLLDVLTEEHAEKLEVLVCKPNEALKQKELLRVERELGIRCRSL